MLPQMKIPEIHTPQWGIPGSSNPLGLLTASGNVIFLGMTVGKVVANDDNDGVYPTAPKATLAGALAACVSGQGDVIVVLPGTYTFTAQVAVDKAGVKILGWDYLLGSGKLSSIFAGVVGGAYALSIEANNIEIAGINISNTFGIDLDTASVENISIHDCIFSNNFTSIRIGVNNTQTSVSIRGNIFITQDNGEAISIVDAALVSIVDNTFLAQNPTTDIVLSIGFDADQSCPNCFVNQNRFYLNALSNAIYRAGTSVDAFFSGNLFAGGCLAITVLADGGYQAVENYQATDAGGALVDATT